MRALDIANNNKFDIPRVRLFNTIFTRIIIAKLMLNL